MRKLFLSYLLFAILFSVNTYAQNQTNDSIAVTCIWDKADHNAFTDLEYYNKQFYCSFRESDEHLPKHDSTKGEICIITSPNGDKWELTKRFVSEQFDLRDSKISIMPDGRLMILIIGIKWKDNYLVGQKTFVSFSNNGKTFTELQQVNIGENLESKWDAIWSIAWSDSIGYAIVHQRNKPHNKWDATLLKTYDGIKYKKVIRLNLDNKPSEARIRFLPDGRLMCLMRIEPGLSGKLGTSSYPFTEWYWHDTKTRLGGPNFLLINKDTLLIASRWYNPEIPYHRPRKGREYNGQRTALFLADTSGNVTKTIKLPSKGDSSYPGMVLLNNKYLYISYYSSHQGKASIYFYKTTINALE